MALIFPNGSYTTTLPTGATPYGFEGQYILNGRLYDASGLDVGIAPTNAKSGNGVAASSLGYSGVPNNFLSRYTDSFANEQAQTAANQAAGIQTMGGMSNSASTNSNTNLSAAPTNTSSQNYEQMVRNAYASIGRSGIGEDPSNIKQQGLDYWTNQLRTGALTPENFNQTFLNSAAAYANDSTYAPYAKRAQQLLQTTSQTAQPSAFGQPLSSYTNPYTNSTDPYVQAAQQTALGNLAGAQAATAANRVNQTTPYGSVTYTQTGVDAQGNPIWSANQTIAPEFQGALTNLAGQVGQATSQAFNPTNLPSYGINPGESYEQAIIRRLQPTQERQSKQLEAQLANQGIMPGSEAYNTAKQQLAQAQNDQLTSAVVGGMQTGLTANQQQFAQEAAKYQMPLSQLNAFRTATAPSYVTPSQQQTVAGPDYLTAYNLQQQNAIAKQAAEQAGQNAVTSGLFGLGSSLLGSKTGGSLIEKGIGAIGGLLGGLF